MPEAGPGFFDPKTEPPVDDAHLDVTADEPDRSDWIFPSLDTEHLRRLRAQLRTNIPGDGTHTAAVSTLLGALVDFELMTRPPVIPVRPVDEPAPKDELEVLAT